MSTLSVSNITDGTDTVETGYVVNGSAKAWLNVNGNASAQDSLNISSTTDIATPGAPCKWSASLTTAMANTLYCAQGTPQSTASRTFGITNTSSSVYTCHVFISNTPTSSTGVVGSTTIHGELA